MFIHVCVYVCPPPHDSTGGLTPRSKILTSKKRRAGLGLQHKIAFLAEAHTGCTSRRLFADQLRMILGPSSRNRKYSHSDSKNCNHRFFTPNFYPQSAPQRGFPPGIRCQERPPRPRSRPHAGRQNRRLFIRTDESVATAPLLAFPRRAPTYSTPIALPSYRIPPQWCRQRAHRHR